MTQTLQLSRSELLWKGNSAFITSGNEQSLGWGYLHSVELAQWPTGWAEKTHL